MAEPFDALLERARCAAAVRDPVELAELRAELETHLQDLDPAQAAAERARFASCWSAGQPVPAADTADALYERGVQAFAADRPDEALGWWEQAAELVPDHFELRRRLGMAQRALGQHAAADASLERLQTLYIDSGPPVPDLKAVLVDRFQLGEHLVTVERRLAPPGPDLDWVWRFTLFAGRQALAAVQVETSAYGRERGVPYLLGLLGAGGHQSLGPSWTVLPPYVELRELASGWLGQAIAALAPPP